MKYIEDNKTYELDYLHLINLLSERIKELDTKLHNLYDELDDRVMQLEREVK